MIAVERRYFCVDHSKFGPPQIHFLTDFAAFDELMTGNAPDIPHQTVLSEAARAFASSRKLGGVNRMSTWVGTSWKMNKTLAEGLAFAEALAAVVPGLDDRVQPFVIPSFCAVREVKRALAATRVKVGAQNMHWADAGAWTGEVSPLQLRDCGLDLVELGHSERREHFGETNETVGLKTEAAIRHGFVPLICVGETLAEREAGRADEVLTAQTVGALAQLAAGQKAAHLLLAYEPVWAIGD
jgi:triosephosphate isomerase